MYNRSTSVYFALPIKFKRQSQSLHHKIKDKNLKAMEKSLQEKKRRQFQAEKMMRQKEIKFQSQLKSKKEQYQMLVDAHIKKKANVRRLEIRRDLLRSRKDTSIIHHKANIIKQYLLCAAYSMGGKYTNIAAFKNISDYWTAKKKILGILNRKQVIYGLKKIVYLQRMVFEKQEIMVCIKELTRKLVAKTYTKMSIQICKTWSKFYDKEQEDVIQSQSLFQLMVYSTSRPYFCLQRQYTYDTLTQLTSKIKLCQNTIKTMLKEQINTQFVQIVNKKNVRRPSLADKINADIKNKILLDSGQIPSMREEIVGSAYLQANLQNIDECDQSQSKGGTSSNFSNDFKDPLMMDGDQMSEESNSAQSSVKTKNKGTAKSQKHRFVDEDIRNFKHIVIKKECFGSLTKVIMPSETPLMNIIILKDRGQLFWLPEYLQIAAKFNIVNTAARKWKLKMNLQQQVKKYLLYKVISINKFYQSEIGTMPANEVLFLFIIKKQPDTHNYFLTCENIKCQNQELTFFIRDLFYRDTVIDVKVNEKLRNSVIKPKGNSRRSKDFRRKSSLKPVNLKKQERSSSNSFKTSQATIKETLLFILNYNLLLSQIEDKFQIFLKTHLISIKKKKFLKMINFQENEEHLLRLQAFAKCKFKRNKYLSTKKYQCHFNYSSDAKILISIIQYPLSNQIKVFIEDLSPNPNKSQNQHKINPIILQFSLKYASVAIGLCCAYHINKNFIQTKDHFSQTLNKQVQKYQKQLQRIQAEKPQRYKNVLRRFMMQIFLQVRAKKNIVYVKKLQIGDKYYALIIKKSIYFSKMIQCNLYQLLIRREITKDLREKQGNSKNSLLFKSLKLASFRRQKHQTFQTIHLFENYFQNIPKARIWEEFYINPQHFLIKPKRKLHEHYIERIVPLDVNSEQIMKEINNYERQDNERNRFNFYGKDKSSKHIYLKLDQKENRNRNKKISIEQDNDVAKNLAFALLNSSGFQQGSGSSNALKTIHRSSKMSFIESGSNKGFKTFYRIANNYHQNIIYYSLLKSSQIYFYLDIYIVSYSPSSKNTKQTEKNSCSQEFVKIHRQRLFKKQIMQSTLSLIHSRIAKWLKYNEDEALIIKDMRDPRQGNQAQEDKDFISSQQDLKQQIFSSLLNLPYAINKAEDPSQQENPKPNILFIQKRRNDV